MMTFSCVWTIPQSQATEMAVSMLSPIKGFQKCRRRARLLLTARIHQLLVCNITFHCKKKDAFFFTRHHQSADISLSQLVQDTGSLLFDFVLHDDQTKELHVGFYHIPGTTEAQNSPSAKDKSQVITNKSLQIGSQMMRIYTTGTAATHRELLCVRYNDCGVCTQCVLLPFLEYL